MIALNPERWNNDQSDGLESETEIGERPRISVGAEEQPAEEINPEDYIRPEESKVEQAPVDLDSEPEQEVADSKPAEAVEGGDAGQLDAVRAKLQESSMPPESPGAEGGVESENIEREGNSGETDQAEGPEVKSGRYNVIDLGRERYRKCERCRGTGKRWFLLNCPVCHGSGRILISKEKARYI